MAAAFQDASLIHRYEFTDSLNDDMGRPTLLDNGGTLANGRHQFGANVGLVLSGGLADLGRYSVELVMSVDSAEAFYQKLIDVSLLNSDSGLYLKGSQLQLYPFDSFSESVSANRDFHVVLTVDSALNETKLYLNGTLQMTVPATESVPTENVLVFFIDDHVTSNLETVTGSVDSISIYDGVRCE